MSADGRTIQQTGLIQVFRSADDDRRIVVSAEHTIPPTLSITKDHLTTPIGIAISSDGIVYDNGTSTSTTTWTTLQNKIASVEAVAPNGGNATLLVVNKEVAIQNADTSPTRVIDTMAGDPATVGEHFGIEWVGDTYPFKMESLDGTNLQISNTTMVIEDGGISTNTLQNYQQIITSNDPALSSGSVGLYTTSTTAQITAGVVGLPSPPYPAPDANASLSVNTTTYNPSLTLSKSAPFQPTESLSIDVNVINHNNTGSTDLNISSNNNITMTADNIDLSATRLIMPSLASTNYMDYNTGKLTIVNDSVGGASNPLLVLQNNNNTAGATTFETYKNDAPTSTGGDTIASWSATCNTNVGKTETSRVNHIAYGVGASNNDGGISLACKVNSSISTFLICNGGVGSGEIQVFKTITTTSPNNLNLACPTAGGAISLTSASNINLEATGDNLTMTAGSAVLIETTGTGANIELKPESSAGGIVFTGSALQSNSAGGNSGEHLVITLNGVQYKIALLTP